MQTEFKKEYTAYLNVLNNQRIRLNSNVFILEKLFNFPFRLFGWTEQFDRPFFQLVILNTFENSIIILHKICYDDSTRGGEILTLEKMRNKLLQQSSEKEKAPLKGKLKSIKKPELKLVEDAVKTLRNERLAHFDKNSLTENIQLTFEQLKKGTGYLNNIFEILKEYSSNDYFEALPAYSLLLQRTEGEITDVEELLNMIALQSELLHLPDKDPDGWKRTKSNWTKEGRVEDIKTVEEWRERLL